jgi:hypothetical protein
MQAEATVESRRAMPQVLYRCSLQLLAEGDGRPHVREYKSLKRKRQSKLVRSKRVCAQAKAGHDHEISAMARREREEERRSRRWETCRGQHAATSIRKHISIACVRSSKFIRNCTDRRRGRDETGCKVLSLLQEHAARARWRPYLARVFTTRRNTGGLIPRR